MHAWIFFVCVFIYQEFQVKFCSNYPGHRGIDARHSCSRGAHCEEIRLWGKVRNMEVHQRYCSQTRKSAKGTWLSLPLAKEVTFLICQAQIFSDLTSSVSQLWLCVLHVWLLLWVYKTWKSWCYNKHTLLSTQRFMKGSLHRFLVHRYSVLRQHAEANGVDGVDALDTASHTNKSGYHDDSDEVRPFLLEGDPEVQKKWFFSCAWWRCDWGKWGYKLEAET